MARIKGSPKTGGREKGTPNKTTKSVRETFERVFHELQTSQTANLKTWADANPTEFYKISTKLIPADMTVQAALTINVGTGIPEEGDGLL